MANYFDKYDPQPEAPPLPPGANYFDKYDPPPITETTKKGATGADRLQAAEGGILSGASYLTTALPDAAANVWNLGKAALGTPWLLAGHAPPHALTVDSGPSPVGHALTGLLDRSPITTTQPNRPDDTLSRYAAAAGMAVPGAAAGATGLGSALRSFVGGAVPSVAGQAVADHPTGNETVDRVAPIMAQALTGYAMPRGSVLKPENARKNQIVQDAQNAGAVFPPAVTNPTVSNRFVNRIAGKDTLPQHAALENQGAVNNAARTDLGLPSSHGGIDESDLVMAKAAPARAYDALRGAGPLPTPPSFRADLQNAIAENTAISKASASLGDTKLQSIVDELGANKTLDSQTVLTLNRKIRDEETKAWRAGDTTTAHGYGNVSDVLEKAIDHGLQQANVPNAADMLSQYREARQTFARIDTVKRALLPSGDVDAMKLRAMELKSPGKMSGQLGVMAKAASIVPAAFKAPTATAGAQHMGMWGSLGGAAMGLFGAHAAGGHMPEGAGAYAALAGAAAIPAARTIARVQALSKNPLVGGQRPSNILPTNRGPYTLGQVLANYPALAAGR